MSTRYYPLYQLGNPQLRIFLPNFWMKLVKSEEPLPPNVVLFQTSIEMTKYDVKNYLEKIYKVPVIEVKTTIKMGRIRKPTIDKQRNSDRLVKDDDYKEALVYLPKDYTFEFPNIDQEKQKSTMDRYNEMKEEFKKHSSKKAPFAPRWFLK